MLVHCRVLLIRLLKDQFQKHILALRGRFVEHLRASVIGVHRFGSLDLANTQYRRINESYHPFIALGD